MSPTVITFLIVALVTSLCRYGIAGLLRGVEGFWFMSAVKAPRRIALEEVESLFENSGLESRLQPVERGNRPKARLRTSPGAAPRYFLTGSEADPEAGRLETAKTKIAAFRRQGAAFEHEAGFREQGDGNILVAFGPTGMAAQTNNIAEPCSAGNGSQPVHSETNRTSSAAGSRC